MEATSRYKDIPEQGFGEEKLDELKNNFHQEPDKLALANMLGYATTVRSLTQGAGSFTMEFEEYGPSDTSDI